MLATILFLPVRFASYKALSALLIISSVDSQSSFPISHIPPENVILRLCFVNKIFDRLSLTLFNTSSA